MKKIYALLILLAFVYNAGAQTIYYVNIGSGNDANSGTSWGNAFQNLTKALAAANASSASEVQIWVAQGGYTPTDGISSLPSDHSDTSFTFYRGNGIGRALKVYGGFVGSETSIAARDTTHISYLDGIIGSLNSYHVGVIAGLAPSADSVVIDGFTFNNGLASGAGTKVFNGITTYQNAGGGLLLANDSTANIAVRRCVFGFNTAIGKDNTSISYTGGSSFGGGVYIYQANGIFEKCDFRNNHAFGNNGGGGSISGGAGGNGYGGGIYNEQSGLSLINCTFSGNSANGGPGENGYGVSGNAYGGAVYFVNTQAANVKNCIFSGNRVVIGPGDNISSNVADAWGGAIMNNSARVLYSNCLFYMNYCTDSNCYGTERRYGGAVVNRYFSGRFDSSTFTANTSYKYYSSDNKGGAIYNYASPDTVSRCIIDSNVSYYGQAVYNESSATVIDYCYVINNKYNSYAGPTYMPAIWNRLYSNLLIRNSSVSYNDGCVYSDTSVLTLLNDTISNSSYNNAIATIGSSSSISSCILSGNVNSAISIGRSELSVKSTKFINNNTGITTGSSHPYIDSCLFDGNYAVYYGGNGGGVNCSDSTITIRHSVFSNNSANSQGGAIYLGSAASNFKSDGNVFINNSAQSGGAISAAICTTCTDSLLNNIFIGNKSTGSGTSYGGGAILVNASRNYIYNNTFVNDTAVGYGGAIRLEGTGGLVKVANNIFYKSAGTSTSIDTSIAGSGTFLFSNNIFTGTNPQFRDSTNPVGADGIWGTADDGLKLRSCSPAVNAGSNAYVVSGELVDITGSTRISEGTVDIGAYESNTIGIITGANHICVGSTNTYTDTTSGGTWVSSNPAAATVSTSGVVMALSAGTTTLSYTASSSCGGSVTATLFITVERPVSVIAGTDTICVGGTSVLTDSVSGGSWLSVNTGIGTVTTAGLVTAVSAGIDTVSYSLTNACGITTANRRIVVQGTASAIIGADTICRGTTIVYTDSVSGGAWSLSNTTIATISTTGSLSARAAGIDTVIYTVTNVCGTSTAYAGILVDRTPSVIIAPDTLCIYTSISYASDTTAGGVWRLSNTAVLTYIDSVTGTFYIGGVPGIDTISYTVTNSCGTHTSNKVVRMVGPYAGTIYGRDTICAGDTTTLRDTIALGGTWSSSDTTLATVDYTRGVVRGVSSGSVSITYSIVNACGLQQTMFTIYVRPLPIVFSTGSPNVCLSGTATFVGYPPGGTWASMNSNATVSATGLVTGVTLGIDTIQYTYGNSCATYTYGYGINIITLPTPATISGPDTVCQGHTITLTPSIAGGSWVSMYGNVTVTGGGVVTGVNPGLDSVKYLVANICGTVYTAYPVMVYSSGYCDSASAVRVVEASKADFTVYPNPASNFITMKLNSPVNENVSVAMTNIVGEKVKEWTMATNKPAEEYLDLASGIYILTASTADAKYVVRIVVE